MAALFFLMCVGGCTGSTSGGIKIFRFTVLHAIAKNQIARLVRPHGVFVPTFNRRPVPEAAAIANVGPGLGAIIGPAGNFSTLPESAKWLLSAAMLLGRLELFTVLILFTPAFWRS